MSDSSADDRVSLYDVYVQELRLHAVQLIWMGYHRVPMGAFATLEEDEITGELVREIKLAQQDPSAPEWVDHYVVQEQTPQNVPNVFGKRRPKMDIEFERNGRGERPHLGFEAKRLGHAHAIGDYLGHEGLAAFLTGYYLTSAGECGMIGYVQSQDVDHWLNRLSQAFARDAVKHCLAAGTKLESASADPMAIHHLSRHVDSRGKNLLAVHVLLSLV
jgi:hypothetical protein